MKKLIFAILAVIFVFIIIFVIAELTATVYFYFDNHTLNRSNEILYREKVFKDAVLSIIFVESNLENRWENSLVIHPFFGYVYNTKLADINNFGFKTKYNIDIKDSKYCIDSFDRDKALVIGIFGGSFAQQAGKLSDYLENKLSSFIVNKKPIVVDFALGGQSLPQQAFIFMYFKDLLDIAVFIDGLNEVWNPIENNMAGCPPEFAKAHHFKYLLSLNELTPERLNAVTNITNSRRTLFYITKLSLLPVIRHSLFIHNLWDSLEKILNNHISLETAKIKASYESVNKKFYDISDEKIIDFSVNKYRDYHRFIHMICSDSGILDIHLFQPNPFVPDSKDLTKDEVRLIENSYHIKNYVLYGYPKLAESIASLKNEGIFAEDLKYFFKDTKEAVWIDACHLNEKGYKLILDRICEYIKNAEVNALRQ